LTQNALCHTTFTLAHLAVEIGKGVGVNVGIGLRGERGYTASTQFNSIEVFLHLKV